MPVMARPLPSSSFPLDDDEVDPDFLCAIDAAEADGLRRQSTGHGQVAAAEASHYSRARKHQTLQSDFSESVASSYGGVLASDNREISSKRSRQDIPSQEGEYLAALRGTHSETWQAMSSRVGDTKPRNNNAGFVHSYAAGVDGGGAPAGACFHCCREGHWAKDCPSRSSTGSGVSSSFPAESGLPSVPERSCPCGGGACRVLVANTEKNAGRQFYRCPLRKEEGQCGYFEWCDASSKLSEGVSLDRGDGHKPLDLSCPCGAGPCSVLTAKTEKNMGRQFYRCPRNQEEGSCGFFKWCDEAVSPSTCPTFGGKATAMPKVGGGQCYKCGMDGHWSKDCPSAHNLNFTSNSSSQVLAGYNNMIGSSQAGSHAPGTCYKCGQVGHWSKDCPNQHGSDGYMGRSAPGTTSVAGSISCYTCGGDGHWSSNCPTSKGCGPEKSMGSGNCFKCGGQGHWSKDCPNATNPRSFGGQQFQATNLGSGRGSGSSGCFKCGGQGHWASECRGDRSGGTR